MIEGEVPERKEDGAGPREDAEVSAASEVSDLAVQLPLPLTSEPRALSIEAP